MAAPPLPFCDPKAFSEMEQKWYCRFQQAGQGWKRRSPFSKRGSCSLLISDHYHNLSHTERAGVCCLPTESQQSSLLFFTSASRNTHCSVKRMHMGRNGFPLLLFHCNAALTEDAFAENVTEACPQELGFLHWACRGLPLLMKIAILSYHQEIKWQV